MRYYLINLFVISEDDAWAASTANAAKLEYSTFVRFLI